MYWLIKTTIISLTLIAISHYLYVYFKNNLTQPKLKDLVNEPKEHYEKIFKTINEKPKLVQESNPDVGYNNVANESYTDLDGSFGPSNMASELDSFLDDSLNESQNTFPGDSLSNSALEYNNFSFNI